MLDRLYAVPAGAEHHPRYIGVYASANSANVNVWASWLNDQPLPLLLCSVGAVVTPGAAQFITNWHVEVQWREAAVNAETAALLFAEERLSTTAAQERYLAHTLAAPILVPPRYTIALNARFNAGAAANDVVAVFHGWYVPRGNLAYP